MHSPSKRAYPAILALLSALLLVPAAGASTAIQELPPQLDEGVEAYHDGHYDEAVERFRPLAEQGHPRAQLYMGFLYRTGKGVPLDDKKAAQWYEKAAKQGVAEAQLELGRMYELGYGVKKDYWEAEYWYNKLQRNGYCITELKDGGRLGNR